MRRTEVNAIVNQDLQDIHQGDRITISITETDDVGEQITLLKTEWVLFKEGGDEILASGTLATDKLILESGLTRQLSGSYLLFIDRFYTDEDHKGLYYVINIWKSHKGQ
jgi:hypothetical protein